MADAASPAAVSPAASAGSVAPGSTEAAAAQALRAAAAAFAGFAATPLGLRMIDAFGGIEASLSRRPGAEPFILVGSDEDQVASVLALSAHGRIALRKLMDEEGAAAAAALEALLAALPDRLASVMLILRATATTEDAILIEADCLILNGITLIDGTLAIEEAIACLDRFMCGLPAVPSDRFPVPDIPSGHRQPRVNFRIRAAGPWITLLPEKVRDGLPADVIASGPREAWGLFTLALRAILGVESEHEIPGLFDNDPSIEISVSLPAAALPATRRVAATPNTTDLEFPE